MVHNFVCQLNACVSQILFVGKVLFGPFIKLPRECQELAVDMLCYCNNFSAAFLKAVAHCCLCKNIKHFYNFRFFPLNRDDC